MVSGNPDDCTDPRQADIRVLHASGLARSARESSLVTGVRNLDEPDSRITQFEMYSIRVVANIERYNFPAVFMGCFASSNSLQAVVDRFHLVQFNIGFMQKCFRRFSVIRTYRNPHADGNRRCLALRSETICDTFGDASCHFEIGLWKDNDELVASIARGRVNRTARGQKNLGETAECPAADEMPMRVVDSLQPIQIEHEDRAGTTCPIETLDTRSENLHEMPVIGQTCEGVGNGERRQVLFTLLMES